jgi:periplasmic divalent cation tolerance protein
MKEVDMADSSRYCMVLTTCPTQDEAQRIASLLIREHLAACVQITGITSCYEWKGTVNTENEQLLLIKARADRYGDIESFILKNHSYEIPEIVMIPIERGSESYLSWIDEMSG